MWVVIRSVRKALVPLVPAGVCQPLDPQAWPCHSQWSKLNIKKKRKIRLFSDASSQKMRDAFGSLETRKILGFDIPTSRIAFMIIITKHIVIIVIILALDSLRGWRDRNVTNSRGGIDDEVNAYYARRLDVLCTKQPMPPACRLAHSMVHLFDRSIDWWNDWWNHQASVVWASRLRGSVRGVRRLCRGRAEGVLQRGFVPRRERRCWFGRFGFWRHQRCPRRATGALFFLFFVCVCVLLLIRKKKKTRAGMKLFTLFWKRNIKRFTFKICFFFFFFSCRGSMSHFFENSFARIW